MLSEIQNSPYFGKKKIKNKNNILIDDQLLENFPINYKECRFIILDTETTGLDINFDRLISINAVEMINTELTGIQFNAYLHKRYSDNTRPLMYYLSDYNYSRENNIKKSLETFLEFVSDSIIITHNALFDMKFINAELKRCGLKQIPLSQCICTLKILRNFKKIGILNKNYKLRLCDLCRYYNIEVDSKDLHQGIVDAIVFGRCLAKMLDDGIYIYNDNYDYDEVNSFINYSYIDTDYNFGSSYYDKNNESNQNKKDKEYVYNNRIINNQIKSKSEEKKSKYKNNNVNFYHMNNFKKKCEKKINNKKIKNLNNVYNYNKNNVKDKEKNFQENVEKFIKRNDIIFEKNNYLYNYVNTEKKKNNNNDKNNKKEISLSINNFNNNYLNVDMDKEDTKISFIKNAFKSYIKNNQQKNKIIYK